MGLRWEKTFGSFVPEPAAKLYLDWNCPAPKGFDLRRPVGRGEAGQLFEAPLASTQNKLEGSS